MKPLNQKDIQGKTYSWLIQSTMKLSSKSASKLVRKWLFWHRNKCSKPDKNSPQYQWWLSRTLQGAGVNKGFKEAKEHMFGNKRRFQKALEKGKVKVYRTADEFLKDLHSDGSNDKGKT